jgi:uncharacterized membrane protein YeaQ/YmgE (transglycosylase-associated protein family)
MIQILAYLIVGLVLGAVAKWAMHIQTGWLPTLFLVIAGSVVGGLTARTFSKDTASTRLHPAGLILSIIGAIIVLFVLQRF